LARSDETVARWLWILAGAVACFLLIRVFKRGRLVLARSSDGDSICGPHGSRAGPLENRAAGADGGGAALGRRGIAGLAIARAGVALLARYGPATVPQLETPVFWFAAALSLATGVICGLYPALDSAGTASSSVAGGLADAGHQRTAGAPHDAGSKG